MRPRDGWPNEHARKGCLGGRLDHRECAGLTKTAADAIGDLCFVYATTARPRGMVKPVITPEQAGEDMRRRVAKGQSVGILFGRERFGLRNEEVALGRRHRDGTGQPGLRRRSMSHRRCC